MPTKIVEVLVTGVVGPKPFPIRVLLVTLSVFTCIATVVLFSVYNQQQQGQNATATAVSNSNASATAFNVYISTQKESSLSTSQAYKPTLEAIIRATAQQSAQATQFVTNQEIERKQRRNNIGVKDLRLVSSGEVEGEECSISPGGCDQLDYMKFTLINAGDQTVTIYVACGNDFPLIVQPGESYKLVCGIAGLLPQPESERLPVESPTDCWYLHPYTGEIENWCQ